MEKKMLIETVSWHLNADAEKIRQLTQELLENDRPELLLFPHPDKPMYIMAMALQKYATDHLLDSSYVRDSVKESGFLCFSLSRSTLPNYLRRLSRHNIGISDISQSEPADFSPSLLDIKKAFADDPGVTTFETASDRYLKFLKTKTPAIIEQELNEQVIGQPQLTKAVADFLYYHALRQQHPSLPQRPLLIAGPSGSGKTEVWRVAQKLYGSTFFIQIIDGSNISAEGWAGNYKIDTYLDSESTNGGILVVDEFDKLATPKHSSSGENVSLSIQAEFLKLVEGEYRVSKKKELTSMTSKMMGFVMVGAFEALRQWKQSIQSAPAKVRIGFCSEAVKEKTVPAPVSTELTDEDFIAFGIMPELLGRIAAKCATKALDAGAYLNIIRGPHSRVAALAQVLEMYGVRLGDILSDEDILALVETSKNNRTGVRWVSAQVETLLLEAIREHGLFPSKPMEQCA